MAAALLPVIACALDTTGAVAPVVDISDDAVVISNDVVLVRVERIPARRSAHRAVVLLAARIIIIRMGRTFFRALSAECPHSGCGVSVIDRPRLVCPCRGSEFDFEGNRLGGPAPTGRRVLPSEFDAAAGTLKVARGITPQLNPNSSRA